MGNNNKRIIWHRAKDTGHKANSIGFALSLMTHARSLQLNPSLHLSNTPIVWCLRAFLGGDHA
jgi:hypothetical protein